MAESQVLISADSFTSPVKTPAWKSKPTWYMVATADRLPMAHCVHVAVLSPLATWQDDRSAHCCIMGAI